MSEQSSEISVQKVVEKRTENASLVLLDCRESQEHEHVAIEGSRLMPMSEITQRVDELESLCKEEFIVYCHHGMRSLQTVTWLRQQGFEKATSMAGGIDAWAVEVDPQMKRY